MFGAGRPRGRRGVRFNMLNNSRDRRRTVFAPKRVRSTRNRTYIRRLRRRFFAIALFRTPTVIQPLALPGETTNDDYNLRNISVRNSTRLLLLLLTTSTASFAAAGSNIKSLPRPLGPKIQSPSRRIVTRMFNDKHGYEAITRFLFPYEIRRRSISRMYTVHVSPLNILAPPVILL